MTEMNWPQESVATGDEFVDRHVESLGRLPELPVTEHPQYYERLHQQLSEELDASGASGENR